MDLRKFCSKNPGYEPICKPFTQGGFTWSTNGWLAIRVPVQPDATGHPNAPNMSVFDLELSEGPWLDLPKVKVYPCRFCKGNLIDYECHECKGKRTVSLTHNYEGGYTRYDGITCGTCEGEGTVPFCPNCSGTGVNSSAQVVLIGSVHFKVNAIDLIKDLPGVQIAPQGESSPAHIRFDGGMGFLLPGRF